ncbi:organic cation/carnitine transporter 2 [Engraulis encrasicolus]|uniref:organic cation/carnitine transporter 2 n=1 Tax=Engraulis encrasicolus TaxID=184585 RepID=UPI002FD0FB12
MGDYDDDTAFLGQRGRFFILTFLLLNGLCVSTGWSGLYFVFVGATPPHHCSVPDDVNLTEAWKVAIIPIEVVDGQEERSMCHRYRLDVVRNYSDQGLEPGYVLNVTSIEQESCVDGWTYSKDIFQSTIVTEWDMVCDNQWKTPMASSMLFIGFMIGSLISGTISDRFGRKKVVFGAMALQVISILAQSFSPSWLVFCLIYLVVGGSQVSLFITTFVLGTELLSKSLRVFYTTLGVFLHYCIGYMMLPGFAYAMRDWRPLLQIISGIMVIYIPFWWFIPESPRWLLSRGRVEEAEEIVRFIARKNNVPAPNVIFKEEKVEQDPTADVKTYTLWDLLSNGKVRSISFMCLMLWLATNMGYYGLSLNTSNLSGDPYLNCFLSALAEVPGYIVSTVLLKKCPRRPLLMTYLVMGGGFLLLIPLIPENLRWLAIALEMIGKFGFTMAFTVVYAYTAEMYPTVLRNVGMGLCSSAARVGSITAPYIINLGIINPFLPYILIGSLTLGSSLVNIFLPETFGRELPETVEQMQRCRGPCCTHAEMTEEGLEAGELHKSTVLNEAKF